MHDTIDDDDAREVAALGDAELLARLQRLLADERTLSARLLVHLGEVDARGLYREQAFGSMFDYCVQGLQLSEAEAYLRIRAARLGRRFPRVLAMMAAGELHLSAVKLLAAVLTPDNAEELLAQARCKSKREVELLLARCFEKPDVSSSIRALPEKRAHEGLVPGPVADEAQPLFANVDSASANTAAACESATAALPPVAPSLPPPSPLPAAPAAALTPLGSKRYKVQLTAGQGLYDKLRQAQALMRHDVPDGDLAAVLERALELLIAERMKRRFGATDKPRVRRADAAPKPGSRHIPHAVRREVLARDGARCSYVSADGRRCEQRGLLELHHEEPFGRGGPATASNIRVLCRGHNQLLAERDYGSAFMRRRIERAQARDEGGR